MLNERKSEVCGEEAGLTVMTLYRPVLKASTVNCGGHIFSPFVTGLWISLFSPLIKRHSVQQPWELKAVYSSFTNHIQTNRNRNNSRKHLHWTDNPCTHANTWNTMEIFTVGIFYVPSKHFHSVLRIFRSCVVMLMFSEFVFSAFRATVLYRTCFWVWFIENASLIL